MEISLILPKLRGKYILRVLATKKHSICVIATARKKNRNQAKKELKETNNKSSIKMISAMICYFDSQT